MVPATIGYMEVSNVRTFRRLPTELNLREGGTKQHRETRENVWTCTTITNARESTALPLSPGSTDARWSLREGLEAHFEITAGE